MTKNEINSWKGFLTIFIIWAIILFGHDTIIDFATNIKDTKPIIDTQIVNNTFKITDQKVKCDIFDYFFNVSRITGTVENISPNFKKNIIVIFDLQDRNGVNIKTEEIKISSLAPNQTYKFDVNVWTKEVKSYKIKSILKII